MTPLAVGDYVLATKYADGDPGDPWCVGIFAGHLNRDRFGVNDEDGQPFRHNGFRRTERITPDEGAHILDHCRAVEFGRSGCSLWDVLNGNRSGASFLETARRSEERGALRELGEQAEFAEGVLSGEAKRLVGEACALIERALVAIELRTEKP